MPVVGRRPAACVQDGHACVVLSEHSRRDRGVLQLFNGDSAFKSILVLETPLQGERLLWYGQTDHGAFNADRPIFPVLILEKDSRSGATPLRCRYVRHALNPEITFDPKTNLLHVVWTWNSYTPIKAEDRYLACRRHRLIPTSTKAIGTSQTWPTSTISPDLALQDDPGQVATNQVLGNTTDARYADGVLARYGTLSLELDSASEEGYPDGIRWIGASIRIVAGRRPLPVASLQESPTGSTPNDLSPVTLPEQYQPPYSGFTETRDSDYQMTVQARLFLNGSDAGMFTWDVQKSETLTLQPSDSEASYEPQVYTGTLYLKNPQDGPPTSAQLDLITVVNPLSGPKTEQACVYYRAVEVVLECSNSVNLQLNQYYGDPQSIPIPNTLNVPPKEPHHAWVETTDKQYLGAVGDPPFETAGGFPGIFNHHSLTEQLLVGGTSQAKLYNPFQLSASHKKLPGTPGQIDPTLIQSRANDVTLKDIPNELQQHTGHVYAETEVQNLRLSTRTLMYATGSISKFKVVEKTPPTGSLTADIPVPLIKIVTTYLRPALLGIPYIGERSVYVTNANALFPNNVFIESGLGAIQVVPGLQGHQFDATGGTAPYLWTIRRTRSSANEPANGVFINTDTNTPELTPDYPFDNSGFAIPDVDFPTTVTGGGLPEGMFFTSSGFLYGTPKISGTFLFRVVCKDINGRVGEQTVRFYVSGGPDDTGAAFSGEDVKFIDPANNGRATLSGTYKTQIARNYLPDLADFSAVENWKPNIVAVGGSPPYNWSFPYPNNPPYERIPTSSAGNALILTADGQLRLNIPSESVFSGLTGVWLWEIQAKESYPDNPTIDRVPLTLAIGTPSISRFADTPPSTQTTEVQQKIPEGNYTAEPYLVDVLVLEPPVPIYDYPECQNITLSGTRGTFTNPDQSSSSFLGPSPVTSAAPGVMTPVGVIGVNTLSYNPAKFQLDFIVSNPQGVWNQLDKFDEQQLADIISGTNTNSPDATTPDTNLTGDTIDDQTLLGKRIRPLWPV